MNQGQYLLVTTQSFSLPIILGATPQKSQLDEEFPEESEDVLPLIPAQPISQNACPVQSRPSSPSLMVAQYVTDGFPWVMTPQNANEIPLLRIAPDIKASIASLLGPELPKIRGDTFYQQVIRTIDVKKLEESGRKKGATDIYDIKDIERFAESLGIPQTTKKEMITKILERIAQLTVRE